MKSSDGQARRIAVLAVTPGGCRLARCVAEGIPAAEFLEANLSVSEKLSKSWHDYDGFVCVMAAGIVVRSIAPLLGDKQHDPCVVVMDEQGRFTVSLLSGHLGGGNDLAREVAALTGGEAVITTASDTLGLTAIDLWAREQRLVVADRSQLTRASGYLVAQGLIRVFSEVKGVLPRDFQEVADPGSARIIISCKTNWPEDRLLLHPPQLVVGIGCNRGTAGQEIEEAMGQLLASHSLARQSVIKLASIDLKRDEEGLLDFSRRHNWPLEFFSKQQLNEVAGVSYSAAVMKATGAQGVAEPAALLAAQTNQLIVRKEKWKNVTLAVATANYTLSEPAPVISIT
jgi:cobalt-precorrin 5A hydrolase